MNACQEIDLLKQHVAELEAMLDMKEFDIRQRDADIQELKFLLMELTQSQKSNFNMTEAEIRQKHHLMIQSIGLLRERVMSQLSKVDGSIKPSTPVSNHATARQSQHAVYDGVRGELVHAKAESTQLREDVGVLENEVRKQSLKISTLTSSLSVALEESSRSLACGFVEFSMIRGSTMSSPSKRFFCLGADVAKLIDVESSKLEYTIVNSEVVARAKASNGDLNFEFASRRDALTFRIKIPSSDREKWRWAYDRVFGELVRRRPSMGFEKKKPPTQEAGLRKQQDVKDSDEESFIGSLSSLASEVRLGLPKRDDARTYLDR